MIYEVLALYTAEHSYSRFIVNRENKMTSSKNSWSNGEKKT